MINNKDIFINIQAKLKDICLDNIIEKKYIFNYNDNVGK